MVQKIDTAAFRAALAEKKTMVVDFYADWCGPCRMLSSVMEALSEEMSDQATFVKVVVVAAPDLARE